MQTNTVGVGVVVALSSLPFSGSIAQASSCSQYTSYIRLPRGECVNLAYLTTLGQSRSGVQIAANEYDRAVRASTYNPTTTTTETIMSKGVAYAQSTTYTNELTPEARQRLQKNAEQKGKDYTTTTVAHAKIENWAYRQQLRAMRKVSGTLTTPRAEYTHGFYIQSARRTNQSRF